MAILNDFIFFENINSVSDSEMLVIGNASVITLEIKTTSGSPVFSIDLVGIVDQSNTIYSKVTYSDTMTESGVFIIGVIGYSSVKLHINSISNGSIKVFGRLSV